MKSLLFPHFWRTLYRPASVNAGLVIGYTGLTLVVARLGTGGQHQILAWAREDYGRDITRNSPEFPRILKAILDRHLAAYSSVRIWSVIQSKGVETRFLVLPDVASRHLPTAAFWTFKKEVNLSRDDIVFDFDVTGARETQGKKELEIMACSAPIKDLQDMKALFKTAGYPLRGITVTSFAFQNLFRTGFAGQGSDTIGTLFIGTDWSRIDIFDRGNLILSRDIKTGTRSMTEVIDEQIRSDQRADISIDAYLTAEDDVPEREPDTDASDSSAEAPSLPVHTTDFSGMIQEGDPERLNQAFGQVQPVVDRLIRQIERTFEHFGMTTSGKRVGRLYFTGPLCAFGPLLSYTQKQLNIPVATISPFSPGDGQEPRTNVRIIEDDEFVPATGLALSSPEHTLNFNFTYTDKVKRRRNRMLSRVLALALVLTAGAGILVHWGMGTRLSAIERETAALSQEAAARSALYGKPRIMALSERIGTLKSRMGDQARAYRAPAMLAEISRLLGSDIRLTALEFRHEARAGGPITLLIKGLALSGERAVLDRLIDRLETSPLVHSVSLVHAKAHDLEGQTVHYFESTLELK